MIDPEDLTVSDEPSPRGPGRQLAAARERAGISLEAMAETLHLAPAQLEAVEHDDHDRLPPPTFVRGYLRAYARELGLDPAAIVAAYDDSGVAVHDPELRATTPAAAVATGHGTVIGMVLMLVVAGGGAGAWWFQHRPLTETPGPDSLAQRSAPATADGQGENDPTGDSQAPEAVATAGQAVDKAPETATAGDGSSGVAGAASEAGEGTAAETETVAADAATAGGATPNSAATPGGDELQAIADAGSGTEPSGAADDEPTAVDIAATGDVASTSAAGADDSAPDAQAAADEADDDAGASAVTSSPEAAITAAAATGPDTLVLEFADRSWIEIYDDRGRELVYSLYLGSSPVTVRGWAPFEVFLGNSPAVRVRFNGAPIEKAAFTRSDNTGRFLVDADGARRR